MMQCHRSRGSLTYAGEVLTCTVDGRPVRTDADFTIGVEHGPEVLETAGRREAYSGPAGGRSDREP